MKNVEVKAKAFDAIVTAYYGGKLSQTYVDALITFVSQFEDKTVEPVVEEKTSSKTEPKVDKPKEGKKANKGIDKGKIKALFEAGWSVAKIAEEMGITGPTVQYHLKALGLK